MAKEITRFGSGWYRPLRRRIESDHDAAALGPPSRIRNELATRMLGVVVACSVLAFARFSAAAPADSALPDELAAGTEGSFAPHANLTAWIFVSHEDATLSSFRIRRAELRARGQLVPDH